MGGQTLTAALRETLSLFADTGAPRTTSEVADELELGRRSTYERLERLVEQDRLDTKKVGASARVWWRPHPDEQSTPSPDWSAAAQSLVGDVLDGTDVAVFVLDDDLEVAWINEATERYFGLDNERVVGRKKSRLVEEVIAPRVAASDRFADRVRATHEHNSDSEQFECRVTGDDDRAERWLEHRSRPIEYGAYEGGHVELYYDITDRKQSQRTHLEDRAQFESLISTVEEYAIFLLDSEGHIRTWNPGARRIKGYEADEIVGEHVSKFYTDEDREANRPETNLETAAEQGSMEEERWRVRKDGTRFWASVTITAIHDEVGNLSGYAKITRDMTERRESKRELEAEKSFVESLLDNQRDLIYAFDASGEMLRWNDRLSEVMGYTDAEIAEMNPLEFIAEDGVAEAVAAIEQVIQSGNTQILTLPLETADGTTIPYEFTGSPIRDEDGNTFGLTGIGRDISDHIKRERRLRRQQEKLEQELDAVFTRIDDAFFALDEEWRFVHVNEQGETILDRSTEELVGRRIWAEFPAARDSTFQEQFERAFETQESVSFEEYYPPLDTWFEVSAYPSESGLSVYFRDGTDRKCREQELERSETIVETIGDGIYVLDSDRRFTMVNSRFLSMTDYEREDLIGSHAETVFGEKFVEVANEKQERFEAGLDTVASFEEDLLRSDGTTIPVESRFTLFEFEDGETGRVGSVRDISERRERERERKLYETIVAEIDDGVYALDEDGCFTKVNDAYVSMTGYDRDELLGSHRTLVVDNETGAEADERLATASEDEGGSATLEADLHRADGSKLRAESNMTTLEGTDGVQKVGVVRDVSERKQRQRELERRIRQQRVVTGLGQQALESHDIDTLMQRASRLVAETLDTDYCKVLDLDSSAEELLLRQGVGWQDGIVGTATVSAVDSDSQAAHTLASSEPIVVEDLATEDAFSGPELLTSHDVTSGISTIIGPVDDSWGILGTHDRSRREFSEHDVNFVQSVANILAAAVSRHQDEQLLRHQREQLAALNSLNVTVNQITDAIIEQSTREEIEATVCDHLAESESYQFAWTGETDPASETVRLRTEAGVDGYLEDWTLSVDESDGDLGPTARALRTGEMQTIQNCRTDAAYEPWHEVSRDHGFESSAAIPIAHDGTVYGVLNVYADRPKAFEGRERAVLEQLGEVVGHAIAATERKRALMGDEVVELEYEIDDVFATLDIEGTATGTVTIDHVVPVDDETFLTYGSTSPDGVETVESLVAAIPHWESVSFDDVAGDEATVDFRLRLDEPPVLSTLASLGGSVETAVIEDGDYHMTLQVSPGVEVRRITERVRDAYEDARLLKRRQVSRESSAPPQERFVSALTDRQQAAIEAAFHAGFFEWPREASGEDVASSLEIAPPTFHQHLRKAERKLLDSVLPT